MIPNTGKHNRFLMRLFAMIAFACLVFAVAVGFFAWMKAQNAAEAAKRAADISKVKVDCLNNTARRQGKLTDERSRADEVSKAGERDALIELHTNPEKGVLDFQKAIDQYLIASARIDAERKVQSFGSC